MIDSGKREGRGPNGMRIEPWLKRTFRVKSLASTDGTRWRSGYSVPGTDGIEPHLGQCLATLDKLLNHNCL